MTALLTPRDVMAQLRVGRTFVTEHAAELGGIKVGAVLRFQQAGIDAYLERQRIKDETPAQPSPTAIRTVQRGPRREGINPVTRLPWRTSPAPARAVRTEGLG